MVTRHHLDRGSFDLLDIALMVVRYAENDIGELDACGLDCESVVPKLWAMLEY